MSWCGLEEIYSNWGSINFLNIRVCVFCHAGQSPAFIWAFSARLSSLLRLQGRAGLITENPPGSQGSWCPCGLFPPRCSGEVSVLHLQVHRFLLLSSPVRCWAHRLGIFLSSLYFDFWTFHFLPSSISLLRSLSFPFSSVFITAQRSVLCWRLWPLCRMLLPSLTSMLMSCAFISFSLRFSWFLIWQSVIQGNVGLWCLLWNSWVF